VIRAPSLAILEDFLTGLKCRSAKDFIPRFAKNVQLVDVHGKRWNYKEIAENFSTLFVPYAKKNANCTIEETLVSSNDHLVAVAL
jgi:hypothetical protein